MDAKEFGTFVQARRRELCMSQAELAEKLHVTAKAVSRWERGIGFPDIKLLEPLADALEITIVELMHSKLIEEDLPKETAAAMVSETVNTIQQQGELSRKRKLILFFGNCAFLAVYFFLGMVGRTYDYEPKWVGVVIAVIGVFAWRWGSRALYCLLTGEQFFRKPDPMWKRKEARIAGGIFFLGFAVLMIFLYLQEAYGSDLRDLAVILSLTTMIGSYMYLDAMQQN